MSPPPRASLLFSSILILVLTFVDLFTSAKLADARAARSSCSTFSRPRRLEQFRLLVSLSLLQVPLHSSLLSTGSSSSLGSSQSSSHEERIETRCRNQADTRSQSRSRARLSLLSARSPQALSSSARNLLAGEGLRPGEFAKYRGGGDAGRGHRTRG